MSAKDMDLQRINYLAVIAAAAAAIAIGALWYSPAVFGGIWLKLSGASPETVAAGAAKAYAWAFAVALVTAFLLALVIDWTGAGSWRCGLLIGIVAWLGFSATTRAYGVIFAARPMPLFFLDTGYDLASYAAMGAILGGWRKKAS